jgi:phosphatidate cytidylyltransferase
VALGNLASRVLVAVVAAPILLLLIYWGRHEPFWALIFVASLLAMSEFFTMTMREASDRRASLVIGGIATAGLYWLHPGAIGLSERTAGLVLAGPSVALVVAVLGIFLYFLFRFGDMATAGARMAFGLAGIVYAGFMTVFVAAAKRDLGSAGPDVVVLMFLIAWVGDTGAYFAGRFLGKSKLYPAVSPGKTWAGSVGGLAGAVAAAAAMKVFRLDAVLGWADVVLLAVPAAILGQLGDLAESLLKRSVGVKDSGNLLPGHGGILDRIDAVLFIAPYTYLYLLIRPHLF